MLDQLAELGLNFNEGPIGGQSCVSAIPLDLATGTKRAPWTREQQEQIYSVGGQVGVDGIPQYFAIGTNRVLFTQDPGITEDISYEEYQGPAISVCGQPGGSGVPQPFAIGTKGALFTEDPGDSSDENQGPASSVGGQPGGSSTQPIRKVKVTKVQNPNRTNNNSHTSCCFGPDKLQQLLETNLTGFSVIERASSGPLSKTSKSELSNLIADYHIANRWKCSEKILRSCAESVKLKFKDENQVGKRF